MKKKKRTSCTKCGQAIQPDALGAEQRRYADSVLKYASAVAGVGALSIIRRNRSAALGSVRAAVAITLGDAGLTQVQIAAVLDGRNRSTISNMLTNKRKDKTVQAYASRIKSLAGAPCF